MRNTRQSSPAVWAVLTLTALSAPVATAMPLAEPSEAPAFAAVEAADLQTAGVDFSSIVALSNCSGSLVRFNSSAAEDKALILTNGHCYEGGFINVGEAVVDQDSSRSFKLLNSNASRSLGTLRAEKVVYATMTDTDVTIYRLSSTYQEIASRYNVQPLTISDKHPTAGQPIRIVSGFWRKIYSCSIDRFVNKLQEGDWTFRDSILFKQPGCNTIGGTSGSPLIDANTHEVIGINNTINTDGESCTVNNPCEVDADGRVSAQRGNAYGQELYQFYACWSEGNRLDLNKPGCNLIK